MRGETVHVAGAGISGVAAVELELQLGSDVIVSDDKPLESIKDTAEKLKGKGVNVFTGGHDEALRITVDRMIVSPGIPMNARIIEIRRKQGVPIIGELELGFRHSKGKIAAITASNGKTTTTALLGEIFQHSGKPFFTAGNIGTPLSAIALKTTNDTLTAVEVSSFQLDTIVTFRPHVAMLLNLTPDHIIHHGGFENYRQAKARLWLNQDETDFLVYNIDDAEVVDLCRSAKSMKIPFSCEKSPGEGAWYRDGLMYFNIPGVINDWSIERDRLKLLGMHNVYNALAAVTGGLLMGVSTYAVLKAVESFEGLPHRLEQIRELDGVLYINDSKCTSVDSGRVALEAMTRPVILIAGGRAKGGGFKSLRTLVKEKVKHLVLIGESAAEIESDMEGAVPVSFMDSMEDAIDKARDFAVTGDAVLLSPLTASFDMFDNYIHRGETFRQVVMGLSD